MERIDRIFRTDYVCRACGEYVGCMGTRFNGLEHIYLAVDCETAEILERCPHCGEGGRWWKEWS